MRITNKIIQNNAMSNINRNKVLEDKLNTQLGSGKKITRPSDDPVIAIRALRLRTSYSEIVQYNDKNAEDAESWLEVTESSIDELTGILEDMYEQCNKGANEDLNSANRQIILDSLKALRESVYDSGNASYAERYLFTGYRTGVPLTFTEDVTQQYTITEDLQSAALDKLEYVSTWGLESYNSGNYAAKDTIEEAAVTTTTVNRLRLAYDNLDTEAKSAITPSIVYYSSETDTSGATPVTTWTKNTITCTEISRDSTNPDPYTYLADSADDEAVFIPETGEVILSASLATKLSAVDANSTEAEVGTETVDASKFYITYSKSEWSKGNTRPEHYFTCISDDDNATNRNTEKSAITYNEKGIGEQIIEYDVGANQKVRVNTLAVDAYDINVGRDVDDIIIALEKVIHMENTISSLEGLLSSEDTVTDVNNDITERDRIISENPNKIGTLISTINAVTSGAVGISVTYATDDPKTATVTGLSESKDTMTTEYESLLNVSTVLTNIKNSIASITGTISSLNQTTDATEIASLESTLSTQMDALSELQNSLDTINTTLSNYSSGTSTLASLSTEVAQLVSDLTSLTNSVASADYATAETDLTTISTDLDNIDAISYAADLNNAVTDLKGAVNTMNSLSDLINAYNSAVNGAYNGTEEAKLKAAQDLEAAKKAYEYLKENLQEVFSSGITKMQNHMDKAGLALTTVGNMGAKLDLVQTRLSSQKTSVKDLVADNEEADAEEVATELANAKLAYDASLAATAKIIQQSLLNYL